MKPQRQDPSTQPYYKCFSGPRFQETCGGIPTRDMDLKNWCEYMRDVKDRSHLTNGVIAYYSDVSIKTIERIMAINCETDIMRATARRIEQAVIGPVGEHICYRDLDAATTEKIAALQKEVETLHKEKTRLEKIIDKYLD